MNEYFSIGNKKVFLIPENENEFYNNLKEIGSFCIIVFYNDGTIDAHITNSKDIKDVNNLKNNIKTSSILKNNSDNTRFNDIDHAIAVCKKFKD